MIGEKQNLVNSKISKDFEWQTWYRRFNEVLSDRQTRSKPRFIEGQIVQPIISRENESTILRSPDIITANVIPDRITNRTNQVEVRNPSAEPWLKARNPRTISDLNKGFKSWVRDDNENDFLDVYNDFDSRYCQLIMLFTDSFLTAIIRISIQNCPFVFFWLLQWASQGKPCIDNFPLSP